MDEQSQGQAPKNRFPFTKALIDSLAVVEGRRQSWVHDERSRGLCLCVSKTGVNTFYALRKFKGRTERVKLGRFPETTVQQARQRAGQTSSKFDAGLNVGDMKRQERGESTLQMIFDEYLERHAKVYTRHWNQSEDLYCLHLSQWKNRRLSTISKRDVANWHAKLGRTNGRYTANNALALLRAMINRAIDWELIEGPNPTSGTKKFKTKSRERYLLPDELQRFLTAIKGEPNLDFQDAMLLLLLTGARKSNVFAMCWRDLNLDTGVWHIPMTKNGEPQQLPLSHQAVAVLRARAEREAIDDGRVIRLHRSDKKPFAGDVELTVVRFTREQSQHRACFTLKSEYVFPGAGRTGRLTDPRKPWTRLLARAEITDFRIHDLRRTHGSYMAATGASLLMIGKALGHKDIQSTVVYARLDTDPIRVAVERATESMFNGVDELVPETACNQ